MFDEYIYYKDIHGFDEVPDLKLTAAHEYYNRIDKSCKELEHKSQQVLTASLTTLGIILGFLTFLLNGAIQIEQPYLVLVCIFLFSIISSIVSAAFCAIETFNLKTYHLVGENDIMETNPDYKKFLIAKYLNYACSNEKIAWQKRDSLKKSFGCFKAALFLIFVYSLFVIYFLNPELSAWINWGVFLNLKNWILLLLLVVSVLINIFLLIENIKIKKDNKKIKQENNILNMYKQTQEEAYYNHLKSPENTELENWFMAEDKVRLSRE